MKLIKFQIEEYKSIKSFDPCWLASDITIFAGKNESGKTAVLEALKEFDTEVEKLSESSTPLDSDTCNQKLKLWFQINEEEWTYIFEDSGFKPNKELKSQIEKEGLLITRVCTQ